MEATEPVFCPAVKKPVFRLVSRKDAPSLATDRVLAVKVCVVLVQEKCTPPPALASVTGVVPLEGVPMRCLPL